MSERKAARFLASKPGILIVTLVTLAVALVMANAYRSRTSGQNGFAAGSAATQRTSEKKPQLLKTLTRPMVPFRTPAEGPIAKATPAPAKPPVQAAPVKLPPLSLVSETVSPAPKPRPMSDDFAPFGRLIHCKLIVTVDSSTINTPIIGLVTEDVYHHGRLLIPAGTEVHGTAQVDRVRERIASDRRWTLVWQTGEELAIGGLALDREQDADGQGWAITDGSAGLRGRLIKQDGLAEVKMFAASVISGAAEAFSEKRVSGFGSYNLPSLQNAPLQGAQAVLDRYADQIQQRIERDGFYVRVPAGKQFYLYVTQSIDRADARIAGSPAPTVANERIQSMPRHNAASPGRPESAPSPVRETMIP